jgi:hypothetical protein
MIDSTAAPGKSAGRHVLELLQNRHVGVLFLIRDEAF